MPHLLVRLALLATLGTGSALVAQTTPAPAAPAPAPAAPRLLLPAASPAGVLKQRVGLTDIEIVYNRPSLKGRAMIGHIEPYDKVWRTGANAATTVSFSTAVQLEGHAIPAGKYALFTIPTAGDWTVILSRKANQNGAFNYSEADDLVRFPVTPRRLAEPVETLEFTVNDLRDDSATINLSFETYRLPLRLKLDVIAQTVAQIDTLMKADGPKPYAAAASFYFNNKLDLNQALAWIDAALAANPTMGAYLTQARILAALGRKDDAIAAARRSIELAQKVSNAGTRSEYIKMNELLIAGLK